MIGIPLGLLYANAVEWVIHRYVLHGPGKKKNSFWRFHWAEHHKNSRQNGMYDADYEKSIFDWNARGKEAFGIALLGLGHAPLLGVFPYFTLGVWYSCFNYLRQHKRSHLDPEWARLHMTGHYDHHMGKEQDANWCVTRPWFDWIMGTRVPYAFTAGERLRVVPRPKAPPPHSVSPPPLPKPSEAA